MSKRTRNNEPSYLTNCVVPLIFSGDMPEAPYGVWGTGFFASLGNVPLFFAAAHCLGNSPEGKKQAADRLCIPVRDSTRHLVPFDKWAEAKVNDKALKDNFPNGSLDVACFTIKSGDIKITRSILKRCAYLPDSGLWLDKLEEALRRSAPDQYNRVRVEVRGFPLHGTGTAVDVENKSINTQGAICRGSIDWNASYPHTFGVRFDPDDCPVIDLNGISGAPVFLLTKGDDSKFQRRLIGMMIRGGSMVGHFVAVRWLVQAAQLAQRKSVAQE